MQTQLTKEVLDRAFEEMGRLATERGIVIEIAAYGGSCLILASDLRNASEYDDPDTVFQTRSTLARDIADHVAGQLGLPSDWIEAGLRLVSPPAGHPQPGMILGGEYPRNMPAMIGLRVHRADPAYMLAICTLADRAASDPDGVEGDLAIATRLMKVTGLTTAQKLADLLRECYPASPKIAPVMSPRIKAKIQTLMNAYQRAEHEANQAWHNTGSSAAPRQ